MQPYLKAMAWAFWQEKRQHIALFLISATAFSIFMSKYYSLFKEYDANEVMMVFALFIEAFSLAGIMITSMGSQVMRLDIPQHLYTKPLSSRMLVGIYLSLTIVSVILIHLITAALYRLIGHIDWPIAVPLIGLITAVLCVHAIFWSLSSAPLICSMTVSAPLALLGIWCKECLIETKQDSILALTGVTLISLCAIGLSLQAVKHARYGERLSSINFWEKLNTRLRALLPGNNGPFKSPQAAFFWIQFQTGGAILPVINLVMVLIALILCLFVHTTVPEFLIGCTYFNLFILPIIAALMAHINNSKNIMQPHIATRPLGARSILLTLLKTMMVSSLTGWIIFLGGGLLIITGLAAHGNLELPKGTQNELDHLKSLLSLPSILFYLLCLWTAIGIIGSIVLAGRRWLILAVCAILFIVPMVLVFSKFTLWEALQRAILLLLTWLFILGIIGGTLGAFLLAVKKQFMSARLMGGIVGAYVLACVACLSLRIRFINTPTEMAMLFALLALPFAPLATAPLALAWNRHR